MCAALRHSFPLLYNGPLNIPQFIFLFHPIGHFIYPGIQSPKIYFWPLLLHINFRVSLSVSTNKNPFEIVNGAQLNLWIDWGEIDIYMKLNFPVYEHAVALHLMFSIKLYTFFFPFKKCSHCCPKYNLFSGQGQVKEKVSNRLTKSQRL